MTAAAKNAEIFEALAPWSVLAAGTLITSCALQNLAPIRLLAEPMQLKGQISLDSARTGQVVIPKWYPLTEAVIEAGNGEIYSKTKDISVNIRTSPAQQGDNLHAVVDFSKMPLHPATASFTLTYSPWFRFFTDPVGFDIVGRVAAYVTDCCAFLCARHGYDTHITTQADGCDLAPTPDLRVEIRGMSALTHIRLIAGDVESSFDLGKGTMEIDQRMFPDAYEAGSAMLKTGDRLEHVNVTLDGHRLRMHFAPGNTHV